MRSTLFVLSLIAAAGCGGGAAGGNDLGSVCSGSVQLCITSCNLGCAPNSGCAVTNIPVNLPLLFEFSKPVDPNSVDETSFSILTARGRAPEGKYFVQQNRVQFIPDTRIESGRTVFGFVENETYTIALKGADEGFAAVRSLNGDPLGQTVQCTVTASLGIIDPDQKPPESKLISPDLSNPTVPRNSQILLEFSEAIDVSGFKGGGAGNGIFYSVHLPEANNKEQCKARTHVLPGDVTLGATEDGRTQVLFTPLNKLPGSACIEVSVTKQVRDLSGKGAIPVIYRFKVETGNIEEQSILETFEGQGQMDPARTGAEWGNGVLKSGKLGGSGMLGEFIASIGKPLGQIGGRRVYEWRTDSMDYPMRSTLRGLSYWQKKLNTTKTFLQIKDGVFEFQHFELKANEHIRFVGPKIPVIRVSGEAVVDGVIELVVPFPPGAPFDPMQGLPGHAGGPGGATGGEGGHHALFRIKRLNGAQGGSVALPAGHPRASQAGKTGGPGSRSMPIKQPTTQAEFNTLIEWTSLKVPWTCRQTSAGGGGGSFWSPGQGAHLGTGGKTGTIKGLNSWAWDELLASKNTFGPNSTGGDAFPVYFTDSELNGLFKAKKSAELFLIGGSGGGGAGADLLFSQPVITWAEFKLTPKELKWSPGGGGGGGGGAIHIQSGGSFKLGDSGVIRARGGSGKSVLWKNFPIQKGWSAGGGGSGGSVLVQTGRFAILTGEVDVLGGAGGVAKEDDPFLSTASFGGNGGAGYIRIEADPKPNFSNFTGFKPASHTQNTGLLRPVDHADRSMAVTKWYSTVSLFTPTYRFYVMNVELVDANKQVKTVVYTDNPKSKDFRLATEQEPVMLLIKSAQIDLKSKEPVGPETRWYEGNLRGLDNDDLKGNGLRFLFLLDRSKSVTPITEVRILDLKVVYEG